MTRTRLVLSVIAVALLAALIAIDRVAERCLAEGGRFVITSWTCVPLPPIHLERDLKLSRR